MNEVEIKVTATSEGLRGEIKAATDIAAAGQEIKVPVRVDTQGFIEDALGRLRDSQGRFAGAPIKIPVDIDEQALDNAAKTFAYGIKPVRIPVEADTERLLNSIQTAWGRAAGTGKIEIPAEVDPSFLSESFRREVAKLSAPVKIPVEADTQKLTDSIKAAFERNTGSGKFADLVKVPAHIDDTAVETESQSFLSRLRSMFAGSAREGRKGGENTGSEFTSGLSSTVKDAEKVMIGLGALLTPNTRGAGNLTALFSPAGLAVGIPVIAELVSSIEALAMAAPIAGAALVGLGMAGVVLKIGLGDVTKAIEEYNKQQDAVRGKDAQIAAQKNATKDSLINADQAVTDARRSLAQAYLTTSDQMIKANEAVDNANRSLADAQRNAASQMITARESLARAQQDEANVERTAAESMDAALQSQARAEDTLTNAQNQALRAQLELTDARTAAKRAIEDLNNKVIDDALAQRRATEDLENAQINLNKARSGQGGDPEAAQTALDEARQRVNEVGLSYQRSQEDAQKASAAGVDGAKNVVSAQDSVLQAQNRIKDAQQGLEDADEKVTDLQVTNAQKIADAKQKVADEQRKLTNTEITTNEAIVKAQQQVGDATRALTQTQLTTADQVTKAQEAVSKAIRDKYQAQLQAKAADESATGSLALYNAMLKELAPNAQDVVRFVAGMHDEWEKFQRGIEQNLFAGITADLKTLARDLLPTVEGGAYKVAAAINSVIHLIAQWLGQKDTVKDIGTIFDNISQTIKNIGPGIVSVLDILLQFITVGSGELPDMAGGFSQAAQKADEFIRHARDTGQLKQWIDQGKQALYDLWQITVNVVEIFHELSGEKGPNAGLLDDLVVLTGDLKEVAHWVGVVYGKLKDFSDSSFEWSQKIKHGIWDTISTPPPKPDLSHFFDSIGDGVSSAWRTVTGSSFWHFLTTPPPHPDWGHVFDSIGGAFQSVWRDITGSSLWHWLTTPPQPPDFGHFFDSLWNGFKFVYNSIANAWNSLKFQMPSIDLFGYHTPSFWIEVPQLPTFRAAGGPGGGLTLLGEQGPELVRLPTGSQVMPAANTQNMLGHSGPQEVRVVLEWQGQGDLFELIRNGVRVRGGNVQVALGQH